MNKPVTEKLETLKKKATAIGCRLVLQEHPIQPHTTITIIPDNEISIERCEFGICDGAILVNVDQADMNKQAKNSRYFKKLEELEQLFDKRSDEMKIYAAELKFDHPLKRARG